MVFKTNELVLVDRQPLAVNKWSSRYDGWINIRKVDANAIVWHYWRAAANANQRERRSEYNVDRSGNARTFEDTKAGLDEKRNAIHRRGIYCQWRTSSAWGRSRKDRKVWHRRYTHTHRTSGEQKHPRASPVRDAKTRGQEQNRTNGQHRSAQKRERNIWARL